MEAPCSRCLAQLALLPGAYGDGAGHPGDFSDQERLVLRQGDVARGAGPQSAGPFQSHLKVQAWLGAGLGAISAIAQA